MQTLLMDLKFALRQVRKSLGFAVTAVLMLAFGIGATTAIFSIVEGVLLRPLPFPDSDRLVVLSDHLEGIKIASGGDEVGVTVPDIIAYSRDTRSFTALGGYQGAAFELSGTAVGMCRPLSKSGFVLGPSPSFAPSVWNGGPTSFRPKCSRDRRHGKSRAPYRGDGEGLE